MHSLSYATWVILSLPLILATSFLPPQHIFSNPSPNTIYNIPSVHESAVLARRILNLSSIATLSTVFPKRNPSFLDQDDFGDVSTWEHPQAVLSTQPSELSLEGAPVGLMDYYTSCDPKPYEPTILAISIATSFRNARAGSNISMSLRWQPPSSAPPSDDVYTYSPANMPRFSLIGYVEPIPGKDVEEGNVEGCFLQRHSDAEAWLPGNEIHESWWGRLVVQGVYWIGGFGDRAYIGWIPAQEWRDVTEEEIREARLVGEEGYKKRRLGTKDGPEAL